MNDEVGAQTFNKLVVVAHNTREGSVHRIGSGEYEVERR
jgi:transposase-like protein